MANYFRLFYVVFILTIPKTHQKYVENGQLKMSDTLLSLLPPYEKCFIDFNFRNISTGCNFSNDSDAYPPKLPYIGNLITSCHIGYVMQESWPLVAHNISKFSDTQLKCRVRNIGERKGLRSVWSTGHVYEILNNNFATQLGEVLKKFNIRTIDFRGDSVMTQVAKYLACDLSRSPNASLPPQERPPEPHHRKKAYDKYINYAKGVFSIDGHTFDVTHALIRLHCTIVGETSNSKCFSNYNYERQEFVYEGLVDHFRRAVARATNYSPSILIFNAGLQIHKPMVQLRGNNWIIEPIVKALLDFAGESFGKYFIFFRETSAQHFNAREGGHFWGNRSRESDPDSFCCDKTPGNLQEMYERHRLDQWIIDELYRQDEHWEDVIGWIPFYNTTYELYDMHAERVPDSQSLEGRADCTHFFYSPFMFMPLWLDMKSAIETFIPKNRKNFRERFLFRSYQREYILKSTSSPAVYVVSYGAKRHIANTAVFKNMTLKSSGVTSVDQDVLDWIPTGPELTSA